MNIIDFIKKMPKIELHLHLEGAIPIDTLLNFINREGNEPLIKTIEDIQKKLEYKSFEEFIRLWVWKNTFIKYEEDFEEIGYNVLKDLNNQNVKYLEGFYSPGDFAGKGLTVEGITEYLLKGIDRAYKEFGIECKLIPDLVRDYGPDIGMKRLDQVTPYLGKGLIGIGLGGSEQYYPSDCYEDLYKEARRRGFRLTAHGGEADGPPSIWSIIKKLHVERIGHGLRAYEDPELVLYLKKIQLPLEMCLSSNIKTGVCKSLEKHPIKEYFQKGLMVTVNSDDPTMFCTSITKEYIILAEKFNFTPEDIKKLCINSIEASFLENKTLMKEQFKKEWGELL